MRGRILIFPPLKELEELLRTSLLEETHERAADGLHFVTWDLGNLAVAIHEATSDLLELQVPSDVGVNEDLGELARRDDELGNEIDSIVAIPSKLLWDRLIRPELAVQLG